MEAEAVSAEEAQPQSQAKEEKIEIEWRLVPIEAVEEAEVVEVEEVKAKERGEDLVTLSPRHH